MSSGGRVCIPDDLQRRDLAVFVERSLRLDAAALIRLRTRTDGLLGAWTVTGFDVLAGRVVAGRLQPPDFTCSAEYLKVGLQNPDESGCIDAGYSMDSAWRTTLPPEAGFVHLEDVPAAVLADLARSGAELAQEHAGPQGPPTSLLDQEVLGVRAGSDSAGSDSAGSDSAGSDSAAVSMRVVMALAAMGFAPEGDGEVVRVRVRPAWLRIDARFGSVFRRRGDPTLLVG